MASNATASVDRHCPAPAEWPMLQAMKPARAVRRDRQVVRLRGLLKTLAEGGRPSVHQLAARFKTRRETIYRDLRALQAIGYPIVGDESGLLSRPQLAPGLRTTIPPVPFTSKEGGRPRLGGQGDRKQPTLPRGALHGIAKAAGASAGAKRTSGTRDRRRRRRLGPRREGLQRARVTHPRAESGPSSAGLDAAWSINPRLGSSPARIPSIPTGCSPSREGSTALVSATSTARIIILAVDRMHNLQATSGYFRSGPGV